VITSFTKKYEDISEVGLFRTIGTEIIRISFKDSSLTFDGNLFDEETLSCLISFFKEKGVKLSPEAEEFIKT
jgi:hypothetical protein